MQHRRLWHFTGWSKLPATDPWCNWGENNSRGHEDLSGILISVVKAEHVALSINQASFKLVHYVAGDPITGEGKKSNSQHSHCMFYALMHCVNPLTIQFRARTPAVCSVPSASFQVPLALLPLGPHTSIIYPGEWRESPVPSRVKICLKGVVEAAKWLMGCETGSKWMTATMRIGGTGGFPDHSNWWKVEELLNIKSAEGLRRTCLCVCARARVQWTCVEILFKEGKEQRGNHVGDPP